MCAAKARLGRRRGRHRSNQAPYQRDSFAYQSGASNSAAEPAKSRGVSSSERYLSLLSGALAWRSFHGRGIWISNKPRLMFEFWCFGLSYGASRLPFELAASKRICRSSNGQPNQQRPDSGRQKQSTSVAASGAPRSGHKHNCARRQSINSRGLLVWFSERPRRRNRERRAHVIHSNNWRASQH